MHSAAGLYPDRVGELIAPLGLLAGLRESNREGKKVLEGKGRELEVGREERREMEG